MLGNNEQTTIREETEQPKVELTDHGRDINTLRSRWSKSDRDKFNSLQDDVAEYTIETNDHNQLIDHYNLPRPSSDVDPHSLFESAGARNSHNKFNKNLLRDMIVLYFERLSSMEKYEG